MEGASQMKKDLFRSKAAVRAIAVATAAAAVAVPASAASASSLGSSTLFATAQGTSVLGHEIPLLGTQGWYVPLPIGSNVVPGETLVWNAIDFTVKAEVRVGSVEIVDLYVDPKMARQPQ